MINHIRTLLINRKSTDVSPTSADYMYIPAEFNGITLNTGLTWFYRAIFGSNSPDDDTLKMRANKLIKVIDGSEMQDGLTFLDSRVTHRDFVYTAVGYEDIDLAGILDTLDPLIASCEVEVFRGRNSEDILRKTWENSAIFTERLAAVLLAYTYRLDKLNRRS